MRTLIKTLSCFTLFLSSTLTAAHAEGTSVELKISGTAKDRKGHIVAIVRGQGLVKKGDIINMKVEDVTFKIRILDIDERGLRFQTVDVSKPEPKPEPIKPKRKDYKYRDPFWAIGYWPTETQ